MELSTTVHQIFQQYKGKTYSEYRLHSCRIHTYLKKMLGAISHQGPTITLLLLFVYHEALSSSRPSSSFSTANSRHTDYRDSVKTHRNATIFTWTQPQGYNVAATSPPSQQLGTSRANKLRNCRLAPLHLSAFTLSNTAFVAVVKASERLNKNKTFFS